MPKKTVSLPHTMELEEVGKLREVKTAFKDAQRQFGRELDLEVSGFFPIAKRRTTEGQKEVLKDGLVCNEETVVNLGSKWIEINVDGITFYAKTERAEEAIFIIEDIDS